MSVPLFSAQIPPRVELILCSGRSPIERSFVGLLILMSVFLYVSVVVFFVVIVVFWTVDWRIFCLFLAQIPPICEVPESVVSVTDVLVIFPLFLEQIPPISVSACIVLCMISHLLIVPLFSAQIPPTFRPVMFVFLSVQFSIVPLFRSVSAALLFCLYGPVTVMFVSVPSLVVAMSGFRRF